MSDTPQRFTAIAVKAKADSSAIVYGERHLITQMLRAFAARLAHEEQAFEHLRALLWDEKPEGSSEYVHALYCNASRQQPVGNDMCSCPIGRRIKAARHESKLEVYAEIAKLREDLPWDEPLSVWTIGWDNFGGHRECRLCRSEETTHHPDCLYLKAQQALASAAPLGGPVRVE